MTLSATSCHGISLAEVAARCPCCDEVARVVRAVAAASQPASQKLSCRIRVPMAAPNALDGSAQTPA